ncbi:hypothetical protein BC629DRAFT_1527019, partial [Irpex lacteus]
MPSEETKERIIKAIDLGRVRHSSALSIQAIPQLNSSDFCRPSFTTAGSPSSSMLAGHEATPPSL